MSLSEIRSAMGEALKRKDMAEFRRLGSEHRRVLHAARPDIKAQWQACKDSDRA